MVYPHPPQAYPVGGGPTNYGGGGRGGDEADNGAYTCQPGGDGVVGVWYSGPARATGGTVTTFGGNTVHLFTRADLAPTVRMTANASGGFTVSSSSQFSADYAPWKATNGRGAVRDTIRDSADNTFASGSAAAMPQWWKIQLPAARAFKGYHLQGRNHAPSPTVVQAQGLKDWVLEGSNDNVNWTLCDTRAGEPVWASGEDRLYTMNGPGAGTAFTYWRLTCTAIQNPAGLGASLCFVMAAFNLCPTLEPI